MALACCFALESAAASAADSASPLPTLPPPDDARSAPANQAAVPSPASSAPAATADGVYVHIDSNGAVDLEVYSDGYGYIPVCTAPCDERAPAKGLYRIGGADVRPSAAFELRGDRVSLRVSPASSSAHEAGKFLTVIGAVPVAVAGSIGLVALVFGVLLAPLSEAPPDSGSSSSGGTSNLPIVAALVAGVGVVFMGVGLPLMLLNTNTRVSQRVDGRGGPVESPPRPSAIDRSARPEQRLVPAISGLPLLRLAF